MSDEVDELHRFCLPILLAAELATPPCKALVLVFNPADPPEDAAIYSNGSAAVLLPVLRALLVRLELGTLRMPLDGDLRWVDENQGDCL